MDANVEKFISLKPFPFPCLITNIKIVEAIAGQKVEESGIPYKDFENVEKALKYYCKFTVVYCESVNLIGYITVDYLLLVKDSIVAHVIVHMILFVRYTRCATFEPDVT